MLAQRDPHTGVKSISHDEARSSLVSCHLCSCLLQQSEGFPTGRCWFVLWAPIGIRYIIGMYWSSVEGVHAKSQWFGF